MLARAWDLAAGIAAKWKGTTVQPESEKARALLNVMTLPTHIEWAEAPACLTDSEIQPWAIPGI